MVKLLGSDPSSYIGAALSKWQHPASWEFMALADLFDVQLRSKSKRKPKPYRRPWDRLPVVHGKGTSMTVEQWRRKYGNRGTNTEGR